MAIRNPCDNVRKTREKLGMNQTDFWKPLGFTQSGGSRKESGQALSESQQLLIEIAMGTNGDKVIAELRKHYAANPSA